MSNTKRLTMSAMMVAIGLVLPPLARMIPNGGPLFCAMHICPLLAGLIIGPIEGIFVGILCPILNSMMFGLPQGSTLIGMCFELPTYGLVAGLLMNILKNKNKAGVYASLIGAMLAGRIVGGFVQAVLLGFGNYSIQLWLTSYFVGSAPALAIHIVLLPLAYFALKRAGLVQR